MDMHEAEAIVDVVSPGQVVKDAWSSDLNVSVTKVPGEPRMVSVKGSYESVTAFLIEYLTMSPGEADDATKVKGDQPVDARMENSSFDKFMDVTLLKETKQLKQSVEDSPQRILARRSRERTTNRIKYGSK